MSEASDAVVLTTVLREQPDSAGAAKQPRMTNRQSSFLRDLRKHPNSLPLMDWPRATTLRKWMRRPRFAAAIQSLEDAFAVEARLMMAQAAMHLQATLTGGQVESSGQGITPSGLGLYRNSVKSNLQVLWMEMMRRQQSHRAEIEREILKRMGEPVTAKAPDDVAATRSGVV
jgi:hypothetical protein